MYQHIFDCAAAVTSSNLTHKVWVGLKITNFELCTINKRNA